MKRKPPVPSPNKQANSLRKVADLANVGRFLLAAVEAIRRFFQDS